MGNFTTGEIIAILGVIGGSIGFSVGLYQYYIAQKWKRSEFAAKLLEELANDERLSTCCKLLDYSTRSLPVPEHYRTLTSEKTFIHNWNTLSHAMKPESQVGEFDWQEMLYRDLFDYFFSYLERVDHYISIQLIDVNDVSSLSYWTEQIASPRFVRQPVFMDFLEAYEYDGVLKLMNKFNLR